MAAAASSAVVPGLIGLALVAAPSNAYSAVFVVKDGDSIQDAVDLASPGDTIKVKPGTYTGMPGYGYDSVVTIVKDDITIIGSPGSVIDATGFEYGIMVGEDAPIGLAGCPPITVNDFKIKGFTIQNAENAGLLLIGVDGYRITHGVYLNNGDYGLFPICSTDGLIAHNFASGHTEAAIYVGEDDGVVVRNNTVTQSLIGIEIENSVDALVRHNSVTANTTGILVVVFPGLPFPFAQDIRIEHNVVVGNNRTNLIDPAAGPLGLIPSGTGILNIGGDRVSFEHNVILGNDTVGLAIVGNFFAFLDARIEPFVDDNVVRKNRILGNGASPDPGQPFPGGDIVFIPDVVDPFFGNLPLPDPDPTDNCFSDNVFGTDFPPGIVALFPC